MQRMRLANTTSYEGKVVSEEKRCKNICKCWNCKKADNLQGDVDVCGNCEKCSHQELSMPECSNYDPVE